jgi:peptidoglycan/xylan/chitin deacetylase (PgdA/CDA1 family)
MIDGRLAVLNYHRVVPDGAESEFYDVPESVFDAQMRILAERMVETVDGEIRLSSGITTCLTFDDGTKDHYRVGHSLRELGLPGVFFVVTGKLDAAKRLTTPQVQELAEMGHRIGSHTVTHARLPEITDAELRSELVGSRRHLEHLLSRPVDWLAPPGGLFDKRVLEVAADVGYRVIRTMEWGYASRPLEGRIPALPVLPSYDREGFVRLIEGRAPLWRYHLKRGLKSAVGEDRYVRLRDVAYGYMRRRRSGTKA